MIAGAMVLCLIGCPERHNDRLFLDDEPPTELVATVQPTDTWVTNIRLAKLNAEHFFDRAFEPASGIEIVFNLFEDLALRVRAQSYGPVGSGTVIWHGTDVSDNWMRIAFGIKERTIDGEVRVLDQVLRITPLQDGWHRIERYSIEAFPPEAEPLTAPSIGEPLIDRLGDCDKAPSGPIPGPGKGPRIRLLFAHTAAAASAGNMTVLIDLLIDQLTEIWNASPNFMVVPELAHVVQVNYNESRASLKDLQRITGKRDGYMDNIHALRDHHKADVVAFIVDKMDDACGRAWMPYPPAPANSGQGFSVTMRGCALGGLTLAHELGHNLSMNHDRYAVGGGSSRRHNYGFSNRNLRIRTIMAYVDECASAGISCARFPSYSHPFLFRKNERIGKPVGAGNAAHNRDVLCAAADAVSQYR